jgi:hypothetical protein
MKDPNQDRLDEWLDKALHQYGNVQPRIGLEGRVAATLDVAWSRSATRNRWGLGIATAAAVCVLSIFIWKGSSSPQPAGSTAQNFSTQVATDRSPILQLQKRRKTEITKTSNKTRANSIGREVRTAASPRLSQFPAARPLSQQEQLLKAYVNQFPKQAVEIALEQAQREKELQTLYSENSADSNQER